MLEHGAFTIVHPTGLTSVAKHTLAVLEAAAAEFEPMLPLGNQPVRVVIVDAPDEFKRYAAHFAGLDVSGLARPGEALIIVKAPRLRSPGSDYPGTLRHELVHLLLHRNVNPAYLPQWFEEGLAMSLANEYRWQSMFLVARMFIQNRIIPYRHLDNAFFMPSGQEQFGDAYAQSLSMVRHLRNRLGEETFWKVVKALRDMTFNQALLQEANTSVTVFWAEYERSLWKYVLIAGMASGLFFQPAAILLILAYWRRQRIAAALYRKWEREEREEARERLPVFHWEDVADDPDAWKKEEEEEEE